MKHIIIAFVTLGVALSGASTLVAADCEALIKNINNERNFLTRKSLVEESVKQCPDNAILVFKYAFSCERFNKPEEALAHYKKAAELDSKMAEAFFGQGDIYQLLKQYDKALDAYKKGLEIDPANVRAIKSRLKAEELGKAAN